MDRRSFLGLAGGAAAGLTLGDFGIGHWLRRRYDPSNGGADHLGLHKEHWANSVCGGCPAGCAVSLRIVDEQIVGIKGSPLCPLSRGGLCARGASQIEAFYDPERLVGPVQRDRKSGGDWKSVSWETAIPRVAQTIGNLSANGKGQRIGLLLSSGKGLTSAVAKRVLAGFGSDHVYSVSVLRDSQALAWSTMAFGSPRDVAFDLGRSDFILSLGTPLLEGWLSPTYVARCFGESQSRPGQHARVVHVDSRLSPTGMRADEWVRCKPGTQPILALGIAGIMLREQLVDRETLEHIAGLEPWTDSTDKKRPGLTRTLKYAYPPRTVSEETGVPIVDILRIARAFARASSPVAVGERLAGSAGASGIAAAHLLNALKGTVGRRGGMMFARPAPMSELEGPKVPPGARLDSAPMVPVNGTSVWGTLAGLAMDGKPPPFDVLFIEDAAALDGAGPGDPAYEMLQKIPLVVSFARTLDASTDAADLVLPTTTTFEQWTDVELAPAGPFVGVAAARPAVSRLVDAQPAAETLIQIGQKVGGPKALQKKGLEEIVKARLGGLYKAQRGMPYGTEFRTDWMSQMQTAGWWMPSASGESKFIEEVLKNGGWVDPVLPETPPSKEAPYALDGRVHGAGIAPAATLQLPGVDDAWAPGAPSVGAQADGKETLRLVPFSVAGFVGVGSSNCASLMQWAAPHVHGAFRPWAELNPKDAARLKIEAGGLVGIVSEHGEIRVPARVSAGIRPGTIAVPWAPYAGSAGRYAGHWRDGAERLAAGALGVLGARLAEGIVVRARPLKGKEA